MCSRRTQTDLQRAKCMEGCETSLEVNEIIFRHCVQATGAQIELDTRACMHMCLCARIYKATTMGQLLLLEEIL